MGRFSGMEISSSGGFFNPRDKEIFIPENHGPFGNCMSKPIQKIREIVVALVGRNRISAWAMWKSDTYLSLIVQRRFHWKFHWKFINGQRLY